MVIMSSTRILWTLLLTGTLGLAATGTQAQSIAELDPSQEWSSQGLVETLSKRLMSSFELLRTDAAEVTVTAR
jgi:hypothetical protein